MLVRQTGIEPVTYRLKGDYSANWVTGAYGGIGEDRTPDLLIANQTFSQLNYDPMWSCWQELNLQPTHYKCVALPIALQQHKSPLNNSNSGDVYGSRTHVTAVKGRCLSRLTNTPYYWLCDYIEETLFSALLPPDIIHYSWLSCYCQGVIWILFQKFQREEKDLNLFLLALPNALPVKLSSHAADRE